jgi:uncharacterized membrane protein YhaH (DUF805 family)
MRFSAWGWSARSCRSRARRLHDLDRTAWWLLIVFTGIGLILLLVWDCMKGTTGPNRFGADPLGA